jgi:hypothetical protein
MRRERAECGFDTGSRKTTRRGFFREATQEWCDKTDEHAVAGIV